MPISAIRTGVVDDVMPPAAIAGKLEQLARQFRALQPEAEKQEVTNAKDDQSPRNLS